MRINDITFTHTHDHNTNRYFLENVTVIVYVGAQYYFNAESGNGVGETASGTSVFDSFEYSMVALGDSTDTNTNAIPVIAGKSSAAQQVTYIY